MRAVVIEEFTDPCAPQVRDIAELVAGAGEVLVELVAADLAAQISAGDQRIIGLMVESHLQEGRQELSPGQPLQPGVSITDPCIGWDHTGPLLHAMAAAVQARRRHR